MTQIEGDGPKDRARYGIARAKSQAFAEVMKLWRKRNAEGMSQADLAEKLGRDTRWLSRRLKGPGNITLKTLGRMAEALDGEVEIVVRERVSRPAPV
jgi:transcriptional regulator with XRE-family HTH domain